MSPADAMQGFYFQLNKAAGDVLLQQTYVQDFKQQLNAP